jgi:hypothetical protein
MIPGDYLITKEDKPDRTLQILLHFLTWRKPVHEVSLLSRAGAVLAGGGAYDTSGLLQSDSLLFYVQTLPPICNRGEIS